MGPVNTHEDSPSLDLPVHPVGTLSVSHRRDGLGSKGQYTSATDPEVQVVAVRPTTQLEEPRHPSLPQTPSSTRLNVFHPQSSFSRPRPASTGTTPDLCTSTPSPTEPGAPRALNPSPSSGGELSDKTRPEH